MPITPIPSSSDTQTASQQARTELASTLDTFLTLLTVQLEHQDPLSPLDSNDFTQQLVQFSQVEQQISANEKLDSLIAQNQAASAALPLAYLGHAALISGATTTLAANAPAQWIYSFSETPSAVTLVVKDAAGRIVHTQAGVAGAGAHNLSWDGELSGGGHASPGVYTLSVSARDASGAGMSADINVIETVSGVDFSAAAPRVVTASGGHDLSDVRGVYN